VLERAVDLKGMQIAASKRQFMNVSGNELDHGTVFTLEARASKQRVTCVNPNCASLRSDEAGHPVHVEAKPTANIRDNLSRSRINFLEYQILLSLKRRQRVQKFQPLRHFRCIR
jgi:hypothetical protein